MKADMLDKVLTALAHGGTCPVCGGRATTRDRTPKAMSAYWMHAELFAQARIAKAEGVTVARSASTTGAPMADIFPVREHTSKSVRGPAYHGSALRPRDRRLLSREGGPYVRDEA